MTATVEPLRVPRYSPGSPKSNGTEALAPERWPVLEPEALHGLAGDVVRTIAPHTEADPAALLMTLLTMFGSAVGHGPSTLGERTPHQARLFVVLVGRSAKARKGTSFDWPLDIMRYADEQWVRAHIRGGLASGEGLIEAISRMDSGVLFAHEAEFSRTLKAADRDGSTLSEVLRQGWDKAELRVMTRQPIEVSNAHLSYLGHITEEELALTFKSVQAANGFGNRFLFARIRRTQLLPDGGNLDESVVAALGADVAAALKAARSRGIVRRTPAAKELWREKYFAIAEDSPPGLLGGVLSRQDAQLLRLSLLYALLDGSHQIEPVHLEAGSAVLRYCRDSAEGLFGRHLGDPNAEAVLGVLEESGGQLSKTELQKALRGGHVYGSGLDRALDLLEKQGLVRQVEIKTGGRPKTVVALLRN